jgi:hypothetical protein
MQPSRPISQRTARFLPAFLRIPLVIAVKKVSFNKKIFFGKFPAQIGSFGPQCKPDAVLGKRLN